jgi:branched-chain amino acid transport system ATP-binding protein
MNPPWGLALLVGGADLFQTIRRCATGERTILLVEQNAQPPPVADRDVRDGVIILEGGMEDLLNNKEVQRAYLGKEYREVWE